MVYHSSSSGICISALPFTSHLPSMILSILISKMVSTSQGTVRITQIICIKHTEQCLAGDS